MKILKLKRITNVFGLGGTANLWGGVSSYIEKFEMKDRWSKNENLWPFSYGELNNFYKQVNQNSNLMSNFIIQK